MADISIIPHHKVDIAAYTRLLDSCNAPLYAYPWYIEYLNIDWQLLILDNYKAAMPLYFKSKWGIKYLPMPFWVQQWGLFAGTQLTNEELSSIAETLKQNLYLIEYNLCVSYATTGLSSHFTTSKRINYTLDLNRPYEQLVNNFNDQSRKNLKTALKADNNIDTTVSPEDLIELFRLYNNEKIKGISSREYERLTLFMHKIITLKKGKVIGVKNENGTLLAAAFFIITGSKIINLFPASHPEGRKSQSMTRLLNWQFEQNAGTQVVFDFEGSMIENVARFYSGFGAVPEPYIQIKYNRLPFWVRWLKKLY